MKYYTHREKNVCVAILDYTHCVRKITINSS